MENSIYDYLTGLYNRKGLYEKYDELSGKENIHFMFLDLDNFKTVNDVYGHKAGDELLIATGRLLRECVPEAVAVRLGGDEFVMMVFGERSREDLAGAAGQILTQMRRQGKEMDFFTVVSMSIGVVWNAPYDTDIEQLLSQSDAAMYEAKQNGKSCYMFYNDLEDKFLLEKQMEEHARQALEAGEFTVCYQPVFHMLSSKIEHAQACVFWHRNEKTVWETNEFRPLFERNGFIKELDLYIFEMVCKDLQKFHQEGRLHDKVSVQLSRQLLLDDGLGRRLLETMARYGVEPHELELALEEKAVSSRGIEKMIDSLTELKNQGFSLALIHFGEDFSSFRYLRNLPVGSLKFEEAYIKENLQNPKGRQIIKTLIRLGKDLKLLLVAEGLVDKEEVVFLSSCGCDAAAGSFYSERMPLEAYLDYTKKRAAQKERRIAFRFLEGLSDEDGSMTGEIAGEGVELVPGISDLWGGIRFPGGEIGRNLICLPGSLFSGNSYTLTMWIRTDAGNDWTSVIYMRYLDGFASLVPYLSDGQSVYRISEDTDMNNGWHDTFCRAAAFHQWCFLAVTYDAFSESVCCYINGRQARYQVDVPTMLACRQVMFGGDPFQKSYQGTVSALVVYDNVKTSEEIQTMYDSYLEEPGFCGGRESFWMEVD